MGVACALHGGCQRGAGFHALVVRGVVDEDPFGRCAFFGGQLLKRIRLGSLLHQAHERLGPVGGVQGDEAELTGLHTLHDRLYAGVILFLHFAVTPQDEYVGLIEGFV